MDRKVSPLTLSVLIPRPGSAVQYCSRWMVWRAVGQSEADGTGGSNCVYDYLNEKRCETGSAHFPCSRARFLPDEQGAGSYRGLSAPYLSHPANQRRGLPHFPASFPAIQKSKSGQVLFTVFFPATLALAEKGSDGTEGGHWDWGWGQGMGGKAQAQKRGWTQERGARCEVQGARSEVPEATAATAATATAAGCVQSGSMTLLAATLMID